MGVEAKFDYIDDLSTADPNNDPDQVAQGAEHLRGIKSATKGSFPNLGQEAVTKTAAELNATITADTTDTLTNKTIDTGTYTGTQTGFVGDVDGDITGNAATVTTNANLVGEVTSVGNTTSIAPNVITKANMTDNSVSFITEIDDDPTDNVLTSSNTGVVIPAGVWNIGESTTTSTSTDVFIDIETSDGVWSVMKEINHPGSANVVVGEQVVSNGAGVRIRCAQNLVFNSRRIFK